MSVKWILLIVGLAILGLGGYLAYQGKDATVIFVTYAASAIPLFFAFLARFKRVKWWGFEAEMWEDKMQEAAETIDKLRSLASAVAEPMITVSAVTGRMGMSLTYREQHKLVTRIEKSLLENGVKPEDIEKAKAPYYEAIIFDMTRPIYKKLDSVVSKITDEIRTEARNLIPPNSAVNDLEGHNKLVAKANDILNWWTSVKKKLNRFNVAAYSPKALIEDINGCPEGGIIRLKAAITDLREPLEDWRYFLDHKSHRDLEKWFDSDPDPRSKGGS